LRARRVWGESWSLGADFVFEGLEVDVAREGLELEERVEQGGGRGEWEVDVDGIGEGDSKDGAEDLRCFWRVLNILVFGALDVGSGWTILKADGVCDVVSMMVRIGWGLEILGL
jgi:hypothetical protein